MSLRQAAEAVVEIYMARGDCTQRGMIGAMESLRAALAEPDAVQEAADVIRGVLPYVDGWDAEEPPVVGARDWLFRHAREGSK